MSVTLDDAGPVPAPARSRAPAPAPAPRVTRAQESRSATLRRGIGGEHRGRLHIDQKLLDPAREYTWIREETLGERDKSNIQDALDNGEYEPVSAQHHPELAGKTLPGWEDKDQLIRRGGLVLMSRPKEVGVERREQLAADNAEALRSVARTLEDTRAKSDPNYVQRMKDERISVTVDRGDTGTNSRERFRDA
jgi:hypothetical protein